MTAITHTHLSLSFEQIKLALVALHVLDLQLQRPETRAKAISDIKSICHGCCFVFDTESLEMDSQSELKPDLGLLFDYLFEAYYKAREDYYDGIPSYPVQFEAEKPLVLAMRNN